MSGRPDIVSTYQEADMTGQNVLLGKLLQPTLTDMLVRCEAQVLLACVKFYEHFITHRFKTCRVNLGLIY